MKKFVVRNLLLILLGLSLITILIFTFQLGQFARETNTTVTFLPPYEWFSHGMVADGTKTVSITTVYGPIAVTRVSPR